MEKDLLSQLVSQSDDDMDETMMDDEEIEESEEGVDENIGDDEEDDGMETEEE